MTMEIGASWDRLRSGGDAERGVDKNVGRTRRSGRFVEEQGEEDIGDRY